jgi:hypothetical protein
MTCEGYPGLSWGYNFPWQARAFYVPVGTPNIVTTVFVANALLYYFDSSGSALWLDHARKSCEFILENLIVFENDTELCFGYIPGEPARVHNANMLGAALLARVYKSTGETIYFKKSRKAINYSMQALTSDYFWPYGELDHHRFIDNFHTGFNLVALKSWSDSTGDYTWVEHLRATYKKFLNSFWLDNGCPKYYHNSLYPIDIHCSAQGIVTCLELEKYSPDSVMMARKIVNWAINNMRDEKGYFYYQKNRFYTNKIPYIRWSQAWMLYALSLYIVKLGDNG